MKLEINSRKKTGKLKNLWRLNNMLLSNQWMKEEIKRNKKKTLRQMKTEMQHIKLYGTQKKQRSS